MFQVVSYGMQYTLKPVAHPRQRNNMEVKHRILSFLYACMLAARHPAGEMLKANKIWNVKNARHISVVSPRPGLSRALQSRVTDSLYNFPPQPVLKYLQFGESSVLLHKLFYLQVLLYYSRNIVLSF